jgi:hypothetical protein
MINRLYKVLVVITVLLLNGNFGFGQIAIKGPTCITTATVYEYIITGDTSSITPFQLCVSGGTILNSANNDSCIQQQKLPGRVLVVWNDTTPDSRNLLLSSSLGNFQLTTSFTPALQPGFIDSAYKVQFVNSDSLPPSIICSPSSGGSCSPAYAYQWQQSSDGITWIDIQGANNSSLSIPDSQLESAYFRRRVTETASGTIACSDIAAVFVKQAEQGQQ